MLISKHIFKRWIEECRVFHCYLQNGMLSFLIVIATLLHSEFFFSFQSNIAMRVPVSKQEHTYIYIIFFNMLHIPRRQKLTGTSSEIKHFINLSEHNSRLAIIHVNIWFLYLNNLFSLRIFWPKQNGWKRYYRNFHNCCLTLPIPKDFLPILKEAFINFNVPLKYNKKLSIG